MTSTAGNCSSPPRIDSNRPEIKRQWVNCLFVGRFVGKLRGEVSDDGADVIGLAAGLGLAGCGWVWLGRWLDWVAWRGGLAGEWLGQWLDWAQAGRPSEMLWTAAPGGCTWWLHLLAVGSPPPTLPQPVTAKQNRTAVHLRPRINGSVGISPPFSRRHSVTAIQSTPPPLPTTRSCGISPPQSPHKLPPLTLALALPSCRWPHPHE